MAPLQWLLLPAEQFLDRTCLSIATSGRWQSRYPAQHIDSIDIDTIETDMTYLKHMFQRIRDFLPLIDDMLMTLSHDQI